MVAHRGHGVVRLGLVAAAMLVAIGCSRDAPPSPEARPPAPATASAAPVQTPTAEQSPTAAINAWNAANDRHDLAALKALYAPQVDFYGRRLSADKVVATKAVAFQKDPGFRQRLADTVTTRSGDTVVARFTKTWTSAGAERHISASIELTLTDGKFLVSKETDSSVEAPGTAHEEPGVWSCGYCEKTQKNGPDWLDAPTPDPNGATWALKVTSGGKTSSVPLTDSPRNIDLGALGGWACQTSGARTVEMKGPMETSSIFLIYARQLYCAQTGDSHVKLISDVTCSGRQDGDGTDFMVLGAGAKAVRLELSCALNLP